MPTRTCTRRQALRCGGAALLCAPFFDMLTGSRARAETQRAQRLILFFTPNGTVHRMIRPSGDEQDLRFPEGSVLEPLNAWRKELIYLDGIDFVGVSNHEGGMAAMLTGGYDAESASAGMSVDQFIARRLPSDTRLPSLELGVQTSALGGTLATRMCYAGVGRPVPPEDSPSRAYRRLFGEALPAADAERVLRRRRSVLDHLREELQALMDRLGATERPKLEQHLEALRELERSLGIPSGCAPPAAPADSNIYAGSNLPALGRAQMDLLVMALACGQTRVASLQWTHTLSPHVFSWLGLSEGHHELSHKGDADARGVANFVRCERWYAEQFAYLLGRLQALPDVRSGGSLLDSSLVLWCKELGDSRVHSCTSVPMVLAGRAGGRLRPGRYLRYGGAPHQRLLTSVCQALGLQNQSFGDPNLGRGALPGLLT